MPAYRVLIGDDSPAFIETARRLLNLDPDIVVVGSAQSGNDVIEQIIALRPDVLLLSINLPNSGGLSFVRRIKALAGAPFVIVLALDDLDDYRAAAARVGADGFVAKSEFVAQSTPLIRSLCIPIAMRQSVHACDVTAIQSKRDDD